MAKIKINDIPRDAKVSREDMKKVMGGVTITNNFQTDPWAVNINNNHYGDPVAVSINNNHRPVGFEIQM